jgi:hypothetical protein
MDSQSILGAREIFFNKAGVIQNRSTDLAQQHPSNPSSGSAAFNPGSPQGHAKAILFLKIIAGF